MQQVNSISYMKLVRDIESMQKNVVTHALYNRGIIKSKEPLQIINDPPPPQTTKATPINTQTLSSLV